MRDTKGPLKLFKRCVFNLLLASSGFFYWSFDMGKAFRDLRAFRAASEDVTACKASGHGD